jgi:hypothetical protein
MAFEERQQETVLEAPGGKVLGSSPPELGGLVRPEDNWDWGYWSVEWEVDIGGEEEAERLGN